MPTLAYGDVTQEDAMPGICKLGLLSSQGVRRGPLSPTPTHTLSPTAWDFSWKEGIFERGCLPNPLTSQRTIASCRLQPL